MRRIVVIPDSFKGTISSSRFCDLAERAILRHFPDCTVAAVPVADGGEGTVDAFLAARGGERVAVRAPGPFAEPIDAFFGVLPDGTAVVESAAAIGLPLVRGREDPLRATTLGVGALLSAALDRGARRIVAGLGGSCTNDGGCGAARALGVVFRDAAGRAFLPVGGTLGEIASIDASGRDPRLAGVDLAAMCDVDSPLNGPLGAAHVFAPQKGASPEAVERLDAGLRHLAEIVRRDLGADVAALPGAGAAGGLGAGLVAFLGARLVPGIEAVLDAADFDALAAGADLVVTGEGRLDAQSLRGKAVVGVARRAKRLGIPTLAVAGIVEGGTEAIQAEGVTRIIEATPRGLPFEEVRKQAERFLSEALDDAFAGMARSGGA